MTKQYFCLISLSSRMYVNFIAPLWEVEWWMSLKTTTLNQKPCYLHVMPPKFSLYFFLNKLQKLKKYMYDPNTYPVRENPRL